MHLMVKRPRMKLSFFCVFLFHLTVIIPDPFAWFPLNGTYNTSEVKMRTTAGSKGNEVYLSLGPDGTKDGSYFFRGPGASSITFSNTSSKFDIGISMTILCWLYIYKNRAKTSFLQYKETELSVEGKTLALNNPNLKGLSLTGTLAEKGWAFVGVSYSETSAEAKLWIDGNVVLNSEELGTNVDSLEGSESLTLGGNQFKGKITQLMLFNLTLTQEQIQLIKRRMKLPGEMQSDIVDNITWLFQNVRYVNVNSDVFTHSHVPLPKHRNMLIR